MTPRRMYQSASALFFLAAIGFFVSGNAALGGTFVALGAAFLAISNGKAEMNGDRDGQ